VKARELEARLERVEQQLRLFQRVSRLMTREMHLDDVLHEIVTLVRDFLRCDSSLIYLLEEEQLVLYATSDQQQRNIGRVRLRMNEGLTGWVARERRLLAISREAYSDSRFKFFKDLPQDTFESFLSVPIISQGKVVLSGLFSRARCRCHLRTNRLGIRSSREGDRPNPWLLEAQETAFAMIAAIRLSAPRDKQFPPETQSHGFHVHWTYIQVQTSRACRLLVAGKEPDIYPHALTAVQAAKRVLTNGHFCQFHYRHAAGTADI
jgi:hypothetical protein